MGSVAGLVALAASSSVPTHDTEVFGFAVAGVVLLVVGSLLSLLATARRTARLAGRAQAPASRRTAIGRSASASVARLQSDVRGWATRRDAV